MKNFTLYCALAVLAAACASTKPEAPVGTSTNTTQQPTTGNTAQQSTTMPSTTSTIAGNPLTDPNNILSKRSVYFDFDSNVVKDEYRGLIQAHSRYMTEHRDARARIEGNCDERGSREYNLALGQRRANSARDYLVARGVAGTRITTISFGKDRPTALGDNEQAWAQNRNAITSVR